ncbi:hypothetical protein phytr_1320 [Candidatus Phycorickettsia trachydisci]|uniref:PHB de-polymerase C-terminal domain-containing protein n=1 Tax=Candidatus Phycorickettsia trachydisci TaxID=2115978 RepID=A0A2P1P743_9RICK|nr:polyhydroxyalkanoate depolymerase [Candidatus Phycorickettsia trachydisci]AVP87092.1 hypothetical protein phytr_1320 [Candidatus Phycorickettsia trachydisci]
MFFSNNFLYSFFELSKLPYLPVHHGARYILNLLSDPNFIGHHSSLRKDSQAFFTILERLSHEYDDHCFHLDNIIVGDAPLKVTRHKVLTKPFCNLLHIKTNIRKKLPKLLVVPPLAGHHASLLSDTIKVLLPNFDVYVTDWFDASLVPLSDGYFSLGDYVQYIIDFINHIEGPLNILGVCQPAVPVIAATAILAEDNSPHVPKSVTLMAGPIDVRESPTPVNKFANSYDLKWFADNMIVRVPANYPGFMRKVYPGFLQLMAFMSIHLQDHASSHLKMYQAVLRGDMEEFNKRKRFYNNYFSVLDLTEEFYLQTVEEIFHKHSLPKGILHLNDRRINLEAIKDTALFCVEGEEDDITGIGQTRAALHLCKNLPDDKKAYHLQEGVGHYGVFSGRRFKTIIAPAIKEFVYKHNSK